MVFQRTTDSSGFGNTRVVFAYANQTKATMESPLATAEETQYRNLPAVRTTVPAYNHTLKNYQVPTPDKVAEVNGYLAGKAIGPAKLLQVRTNDVVTTEIYARYTAGTGGSTAIIGGLAAAVTGAFGLTSGETAYTAITNNMPAISGSLTPGSSVPKAYFIYILFKSDYTGYQFGYQMVSSAALTGFEKLTVSVTVPAAYDNGYLYTYVANESNVASASSVYFDDIFSKHVKAALGLQVTQATDYYPFGLGINPLGYAKTATYGNDYKYNGKELQDEHSLGWLDYGARMYMADVGRWGVLDALSDIYRRYSPYNYALNNPIRFVDPDGTEVFETQPRMSTLVKTHKTNGENI